MMLHYALRPGKCSRSSVARIKICLTFADTCLEEMAMCPRVWQEHATLLPRQATLCMVLKVNLRKALFPPAGGDASFEPEQ